jgi:hypothetical protein
MPPVFKISIEFESETAAGAAHELTEWCSRVAGGAGTPPVVQQEAPAEKPVEKTTSKKRGSKPAKKAEEPTQQEDPPETKPEEADDAKPSDGDADITLDKLREYTVSFVTHAFESQDDRREAFGKLLKPYGVANLSKVQSSDFAAFLEAVDTEVGALDKKVRDKITRSENLPAASWD